MVNDIRQYGRYGDDNLMHVSNEEIAGIESLFGELPRNPVTGLPEAFSLRDIFSKETLVPILGTVAGTMIGGPIGGAVGSGLATTAVTGDIERGLMAGVMSYGLGSAMGAAGSAMKSAGEAGATAALDTTTSALTNEAAHSALQAGVSDAVISGAVDEGVGSVLGSLTDEAVSNSIGNTLAQGATEGVNAGITRNLTNAVGQGFGKDVLGQAVQRSGWDVAKAGGKAFMSELVKPKNFIPFQYGASTYAQMNANEHWREQMEKYDKRRKDRRGEYQRLLSEALAAGPRGYATGGSIEGMDKDFMGRENPFYAGGDGPDYGGRTPLQVQQQLRGPVQVQPPEGYRPGIDPEWNFFPGAGEDGGRGSETPGNDVITPQNPDDDWGYSDNDLRNWRVSPDGRDISRGLDFTDQLRDPLDSDPWMRGDFDALRSQFIDRYGEDALGRTTGPYAGMNPSEIAEAMAFQAQNPSSLGGPKPKHTPADGLEGLAVGRISRGEGRFTGMADGGMVPARDGMVQPSPFDANQMPQEPMDPMPEGGIEELPTKMSEADIEILRQALTGQMGEAETDYVINVFIDKYGVDMFKAVRDQIVSDGLPFAQTEGMIEGQGGGMDDQVLGQIAGQEPVAVSPGEYIVPADVVSGLGDGSSQAGADKLDGMLDRVRAARQGGAMNQPPPISDEEVMPV